MTKISIHLLGPVQISLDGRTLPISRRGVRGLLLFVAARGGHVSREELLTTFWPDHPTEFARARLREGLSRLKHELPGDEVLQADMHQVWLDLQRVYIDQVEYDQLLRQASRVSWQSPLLEPLPQAIYQPLSRAASLWRGPTYMQGANLPNSATLDTWQSLATQELEHSFGLLLKRLAEHHLLLGEPELALSFARQGQKNHELDEVLHQLILTALLRSGNKTEAIEHYRKLEKLLRNKLRVNPNPQLVQLYQMALEKTANPSQVDQSLNLNWRLRFNYQVAFVGREQALAKLHAAYFRGGGVFIKGEPGQGKTRLMQEFSTRVWSQTRVMLTTCQHEERSLPFQPFIDLLRRDISREEWRAFPTNWASQLTLLLPELSDLRPRLQAPVEEYAPEAERGQAGAQLIEGIRQVFVQAARGRRLVLIVDDAQWADEMTLTTLAYLMRRPPFLSNALVIAVIRPEDSSARLLQMAKLMQDEGNAQIIELEALNAVEVATLAQNMLGSQPGPDFVQALLQETGGNPLFLLEILNDLLTQDLEHPEDLILHMPFSSSLQTMIQSRLRKLSPAARTALEIGAVLGTEFDPAILLKVGQLEQRSILQALQEAEASRLVSSIYVAQGQLRYRFIHHKMREVLLDSIGPLHQRWLHGEIARYLENTAEVDPLAQAAVIAEHLGKAGEYGRAYDYWLRAGRRARRLFALQDAKNAFRQASELVAHIPRIEDQQLYNLYTEWIEMKYELNDAQKIQTLSEQLLHLGEQRKSALLIGTAYNRQSDAYMTNNDFAKGFEIASKAISYLEQCKSQNLNEYMEALIRCGVFLLMMSRPMEALASFQNALEAGEFSDDPLVYNARGDAHYQIATTLALSGWPETAVNHAKRSLQDYTTVGRPYGQVMAYSALTLSRYLLGDLVRARADAELGIALAERSQGWRMLGYLCSYLAINNLANGKSDSALQLARRAMELGDRFGHDEISCVSRRAAGDVYALLGDYDTALAYYQAGLQASRNGLATPDLMVHLGAALCWKGDYAQGTGVLQQANEFVQQAGLGSFLVMALLAQTHAYLKLNDLETAQRSAQQAYDESLQRRMSGLRIQAMTLLGQIQEASGNIPGAYSFWRPARREAAETEMTWLELRLLNLLIPVEQDPEVLDGFQRRLSKLLEQIVHETQDPDLAPALARFMAQFPLREPDQLPAG